MGPPPAGIAVSVVVPLFDNAATVAELCARVRRALQGHRYEIVLVVDACPRGSADAAERAAAADPSVRPVLRARRAGQHKAALTGLAEARGEWVVVLDGDLQDPPEAIPALLDEGRRRGADTVFALRQGQYESAGRHLTSRWFRWLLTRLTELPRNAGMFFAARCDVVARVLEMQLAHPYVVAMVGHAARTVATVAVPRAPRPVGRSAYTARRRVGASLCALACIVELRRMGAGPS